MKKFVKVLATSAMALSFAAVSAMAGNDMPSGKHFQISFIGHPTNDMDALGGKADASHGRAIMIPLGIPKGGKKKTGDLMCEGEQVNVTDATDDGIADAAPANTRIYFTADPENPGYKIIDRDATDGSATVQLDTIINDDGVIVRNFDVYVRVLGKPNRCMEINGYVQENPETTDGGTDWYKTGTITLNRKAGRPTAENANDLFDVMYDDGDGIKNYSVWDSYFQNYLWDLDNKGVRNVQVRFYPKTGDLNAY